MKPNGGGLDKMPKTRLVTLATDQARGKVN